MRTRVLKRIALLLAASFFVAASIHAVDIETLQEKLDKQVKRMEDLQEKLQKDMNASNSEHVISRKE